MPITWTDKILLAKIETSYGTDAAPTGAANAILAKQVSLTPMEGSDVSRDLETPFMGAQGTIPTELHAKLAFQVELAPSGAAGTAPAWGPLLRACGVAETIVASTSVTYNPVSSGHESVSIYLWVGGTRYVLTGARGTCKISLAAQAIPMLEFELTGLFTQPGEQARPTPTLSAFKKPLVASNVNTPTFTIGGTAFVMRACKLDLGNDMQNRFLIGSEDVLITDKSEVLETTVEAVALSTFDPFQLAADQTSVAVALVHGTVAGAKTALDVPAAQMQRPQGLENAQNIAEWPLRLVPLPVSGNDQWTLTLT